MAESSNGNYEWPDAGNSWDGMATKRENVAYYFDLVRMVWLWMPGIVHWWFWVGVAVGVVFFLAESRRASLWLQGVISGKQRALFPPWLRFFVYADPEVKDGYAPPDAFARPIIYASYVTLLMMYLVFAVCIIGLWPLWTINILTPSMMDIIHAWEPWLMTLPGLRTFSFAERKTIVEDEVATGPPPQLIIKKKK